MGTCQIKKNKEMLAETIMECPLVKAAIEEIERTRGYTFCTAQLHDELISIHYSPYGTPEHPIYREKQKGLNEDCPLTRLLQKSSISTERDAAKEELQNSFSNMDEAVKKECKGGIALSTINEEQKTIRVQTTGPCYSCLALYSTLRDLHPFIPNGYKIEVKSSPAIKERAKKEADERRIALKVMSIGIRENSLMHDLLIPDGPFFFSGIDASGNVHIIVKKMFHSHRERKALADMFQDIIHALTGKWANVILEDMHKWKISKLNRNIHINTKKTDKANKILSPIIEAAEANGRKFIFNGISDTGIYLSLTGNCRKCPAERMVLHLIELLLKDDLDPRLEIETF